MSSSSETARVSGQLRLAAHVWDIVDNPMADIEMEDARGLQTLLVYMREPVQIENLGGDGETGTEVMRITLDFDSEGLSHSAEGEYDEQIKHAVTFHTNGENVEQANIVDVPTTTEMGSGD